MAAHACAALFVPNALRLARRPAAAPSLCAPSDRPFCASEPRAPPAVRASSRRVALNVAPDAVAAAAVAQSARRATRKHTAESRRKIAMANRGNVPWNKGRPHSEETRRKIAENTRRAMLRPEMRMLLKQRATGRKHSEITKMKIRNSSRLSRAAAVSNGANPAPRRLRRRPLPFVFEPRDVQRLNHSISQQIDASFAKAPDDRRYVVSASRSLSESTKAKLSQRIKQLWNDPQYRHKVARGIEQRRQVLSTKRAPPATVSPSDASVPSETTPSATKKRRHQRHPAQRPRTQQLQQVHLDQDAPQPTADDDIVIRSDDLEGITMEELGITDCHQEGIVLAPPPLSPSFFAEQHQQLQTALAPEQATSSGSQTQPAVQRSTCTPPDLDLDWMLDLSNDVAVMDAHQPFADQRTRDHNSLCDMPLSAHVDAHVVHHSARVAHHLTPAAAVGAASMCDAQLEFSSALDASAEQPHDDELWNGAESLLVSSGSDFICRPPFKLATEDDLWQMRLL
eukprot:TRINITY_DN976_c0_g2_i1.p1 TRINITY_DN976_c0_g2~~TRINITY_DN976_c0_g2_i1.p1  ORF type:complete len:533 (+),score=139.74 TRINITY_DN976_c0_g2_i1:67-1599(+)